jgi:hypothetical protein
VSTTPARPARANATLLLNGYGPLVAFMVFFALMAIMAPTVTVDGEAAAGSAGGTGDGSEGADASDGGAQAGGQDGNGGGPEVDDPGGADDGQEAQGSGGGGDGDGGGGDGEASQAEGAGAEGCADRDLQVPGDPYSPPCVAFEGDNGGATARGVTADEIVITARTPDEPGFQDELANLAEADIADRPQDIQRTFTALVEYFNERFEFYGRELRIEFYEGQGSPTTELLGGGREQAQADALTVANEFEAFAEMNAGSEPFGDALATQEVVNFGVPFLSREWMTERRPFSWSMNTDCSIVAESAAHYANVRLAHGDQTADHAGGDLQGQERRVANVVPENPWYQECLDAAMEIARAEGNESELNLSYQLDLNTMSNQAANLIARLQNENITTVICSCDPVLPVFLTARAQEQGYQPEWVITGTGFTDQDFIGQLFHQDQWSRAFGISYAGQTQPQESTLGYNAYRQVRDDEPAFSVQTIYYSLYLLAIGIQGAGPELTPETFEQGMFDYPEADGPAGTWGFGEGNYSPAQNFREIYWDPEEVSPFNSQPGAWIQPDDERHRPGELPDGPPKRP